MALDYPHLEFTAAFWWSRPEGRNLRLGITRAAAEGLTYVTHVDLVEVGATFHGGQPVGTIESQKVVCDLFAPLSGQVVEHNPAIRDRPFLVNSDPEGEGWLLLVERLDAKHGSEEAG
jgi:glycine cleavage system H protein